MVSICSIRLTSTASFISWFDEEKSKMKKKAYVEYFPSYGKVISPLIPPQALWPITTMYCTYNTKTKSFLTKSILWINNSIFEVVYNTLRWRTAYSMADPVPEYLSCFKQKKKEKKSPKLIFKHIQHGGKNYWI